MILRIKNRLSAGNEVVAELEADDVSCRRWVAIYPVKKADLPSFPYLKGEYNAKDLINSPTEWAYRVLRFDVKSEYIENGWDISEAEMINTNAIIVFGYDALIDMLNENHVNMDLFLEPWKTDYPL